MAKVLILTSGRTIYDASLTFLDLMARELGRVGLASDAIDVSAEGGLPLLLDALKTGEYLFALTFGGIGVDVRVNDPNGDRFIERRVWETFRVPVFSWFCDHPCHAPERHQLATPWIIRGYVFPDHARYAVDHFPANGGAYAAHLGFPAREDLGWSAPDPARKNGRLVLAKSCGDPEAIQARWREGHVDPFRAILFAAAEAAWGRSCEDYRSVIEPIAAEHGVFFGPNNNVLMALMRQLDLYLRSRTTTVVGRALRDHPVDVYGQGWEHVDWSGGRAVFKGVLPHRELMAALPAYVGSVSINPNVQDSVHDRVFHALSAGVVPVGDDNRFMRRFLPDLAPYTYKADSGNETVLADSARAAVDAVLADVPAALGRGERTLESLYPRFSLAQAVRQVLAAVGYAESSFAFNQGFTTAAP
jgi:hypothetical protein